MEFLSEQQRLLRDAVREFATRELAPHAARWDREANLPDEVVGKLGGMGVMGMMVAPRYGGTFSDYVSFGLAVEEVAACCGGTSVLVQVHNAVGCLPIATFGTEAQKRAFLPDLAAGRKVGSFCLTEAQAGSEANNLSTRAVLKDGKGMLNRQKLFFINRKS